MILLEQNCPRWPSTVGSECEPTAHSTACSPPRRWTMGAAGTFDACLPVPSRPMRWARSCHHWSWSACTCETWTQRRLSKRSLQLDLKQEINFIILILITCRCADDGERSHSLCPVGHLWHEHTCVVVAQLANHFDHERLASAADL